MKGLPQTLRHTYRTMFSRPVLFIWAASWLVAAVAGPFGTYETMPSLPRTIYWIAISSTSILIVYLGFGITIWLAGEENHPRQAWVGALVSSALVGPVVWAVTYLAEMLGTGVNPGFWTMLSTPLLSARQWRCCACFCRRFWGGGMCPSSPS